MVSSRLDLRLSRETAPRRGVLNRLIEFQGMREWSCEAYRDAVRHCYDGPAGAILRLGSLLSLHEPLVGRLFETRQFDLQGRRSLLDIGSGAGQILRHLVERADPGASIVATDLSTPMLARARTNVPSSRPHYVTADLVRLPFPDNSFDAITCGWVLEYQKDPVPAFQELRRVLQPGGSLLVLATEDCLSGAIVSRAWKCRTYTEAELHDACLEAGLVWRERLWLTPLHRSLKAGGIIFAAVKPAAWEGRSCG